jgi:NDP-sugar pyrophosphorylase family protein
VLTVAILAGGLATRLRPLTDDTPKALIEINGKPFLHHQLTLLRDRGLTRVVLCVGYRDQQIRTYAGDGSRFGLEIEYSSDGPVLLGTGGAIRRALPLLGTEFMVLYGDSYLPCDYARIEECFQRSSKQGLMTVFRNQGLWDSSNVEFFEGRILSYEKIVRTERMRHIDYGLGAFRSSVFKALPEGQPCDLAGIYQDLLRRDELAAFEVEERFYEIGSYEGIRELSEFLS